MSDTEPVKEEISPKITGEKTSDVAKTKAAERKSLRLVPTG